MPISNLFKYNFDSLKTLYFYVFFIYLYQISLYMCYLSIKCNNQCKKCIRSSRDINNIKYVVKVGCYRSLYTFLGDPAFMLYWREKEEWPCLT